MDISKNSPSIARRLALGITAIVVLFWLGAVAIGGFMFRHEIDEAFDASLQQAASRLLPLAVHDLTEEEDDEISPYSVGNSLDRNAAFQYSILDAQDRPVLNSQDGLPSADLATIPLGYSQQDGFRFFSLSDVDSGYRIVIIERSGHRDEALLESLFALLLPLGALVPLAGFGIWFAIGKAMRPLNELSRDIGQRSGSDLSPLNIDRQPQELAPIARAVESLMERLKSALQAERAFAANSAHELRTPLAGALAQVQRLGIELENERGSERVKEIDHALRNLANLSEQVLTLSRLEAGFAKSDNKIHLNPILDLVLKDFDADTRFSNILVLENAAAHQIHAKITQDAFAVVMRNLIQNAIKHGEKNGTIAIEIRSGHVIAVCNETQVITADQLKRISQPFERGHTKADGSGLGLSIVTTVMEQCGGRLELNSAASDRASDKTSRFEAILVFKPAITE